MARTDKKAVYAFIDSQNLNVSTQKFGWKMDWRKFRKWLEDNYGVTRAFMFIGYLPENMEMYEFLHSAGYSIVLKPTLDMVRPPVKSEEKVPFKTFGEQVAKDASAKKETAPNKDDSSQNRRLPVKGNVDAELTLWAVKEMPNYQKAVIVSGDGDFYSLVEYLLAKGKLQKVLTPTAHYSSLFKPFNEHIEELGRHRKFLAYHDKKRRKK